jgi:hypothetical protein
VADHSGQESASEHMQKLGDVISDPKLRKSFFIDPSGTLRDAGVDVDEIPHAVRETLFDLSHEELRSLARVKGSLRGARMSQADIGEIV